MHVAFSITTATHNASSGRRTSLRCGSTLAAVDAVHRFFENRTDALAELRAISVLRTTSICETQGDNGMGGSELESAARRSATRHAGPDASLVSTLLREHRVQPAKPREARPAGQCGTPRPKDLRRGWKCQTTTGRYVEMPSACSQQVRVGRGGEQYKMLCLERGDTTLKSTTEATPCRVLSVGSNGDAAFEIDMRRRYPGCLFETWDGTLGGAREHLRHQLPSWLRFVDRNFDYSSSGVWLQRQHTTRSSADASKPSLSVLKIDCEGCEFKALMPWLSSVCTEQVLLELHFLKRDAPKLAKLLAALSSEYHLFYGENNPVCGGPYSGHRCLETAWHRRRPCL
jgi:hypothetical protein